MSKIVRKTAKIFGSNASTNQIAQFGSLAASAPQLFSGATADPSTIQALGNWLSGWFAGVEGASSPAIEDLNAFCYVMAYQIAYQMQTGVPEWDSGTTYYIGSMVTANSQIYVSLQDNNLNHAVSSSSFWLAITASPTTQTYTPVVTPNVGTFGSTIYSGEYIQTGNMVTLALGLQFTQSGTTTNSMTVSLPVRAVAGQCDFQCSGPSSHYFRSLSVILGTTTTITISGGASGLYSVNGNGAASLTDFTNGVWTVEGIFTYIAG